MSAPPRVIAIDWSGRAKYAAKSIWIAECDQRGHLLRLENGRDRGQTASWIINKSQRAGPLVVGLDFAFAFPRWFMHKQGWADGPACWSAMSGSHGLAEHWLKTCHSPFWGRPGKARPAGIEMKRECESGGTAKSVFQIGGAGAVGTGSLRGMGTLHTLHAAGLAVWPFTLPRASDQSLVIEIYPRLLTGAVVKSDALARSAYLRANFSDRMGTFETAAESSEDAFDAAVSALVMHDHIEQIGALAPSADDTSRIEGMIWAPR